MRMVGISHTSGECSDAEYEQELLQMVCNVSI